MRDAGWAWCMHQFCFFWVVKAAGAATAALATVIQAEAPASHTLKL